MDNMIQNQNVQGTDTAEPASKMSKRQSWEEKYGKKKKDKKKGKKGLIIGIIIAVIAVILIVYVVKMVKSSVAAVQEAMGEGTVVEEFGEKDMSAYIDVTGTVESQNVERVTTSLTYPVEEIKVKVGDHVKKGDVVCVIDSSEIDDKIEELEEQASDEDKIHAKEIETASHNLSTQKSTNDRALDSANVTVSEAKKAFDDADADYYEKKDAYDAAVASETSTDEEIAAAKEALDAASDVWYEKQYAYDQATSAYNDTLETTSESYQSVKDSTDMTVISNSSSYSSTASQLADYYKMKNNTEIIAETSGVVTSIDAVEGVAASGSIMTIQDDASFQLIVPIKERDIFTIKEGMKVELSSNTLTNVKGSGTITSVYDFAVEGTPTISATGQTSAGDNEFKAVIEVDDATDILLGMKLKCRIVTGDEISVDAVPYTAIISDVDGDYVYVAEEAGNGFYMVSRRAVEKGMSGDYYTEITGGELHQGDKVVTYPNTVTADSVITIKE